MVVGAGVPAVVGAGMLGAHWCYRVSRVSWQLGVVWRWCGLVSFTKFVSPLNS